MIQVNEPRNKLHPRYHHSTLLLQCVESCSHGSVHGQFQHPIMHSATQSFTYSSREHFTLISRVEVQNLVVLVQFRSNYLKFHVMRDLKMDQQGLLESDVSYNSCRYISQTLSSSHLAMLNDSVTYHEFQNLHLLLSL